MLKIYSHFVVKSEFYPKKYNNNLYFITLLKVRRQKTQITKLLLYLDGTERKLHLKGNDVII